MNCLKCFLFVAAWLGLHGSENVRAHFVMQFADANGSLVTQYPTIEVGQTVDIYVYLLQDSGTLLTEEGIFSAAFKVDYRDQIAARVLSESDFQPNSVFDFSNQLTLDSAGVIVDLSSSFDPVLNFGTQGDPNRMLLTMLRLTGVNVGTMQLGFSDLDSPGFLTKNSDEFDAAIDFSAIATLNVVATPEPSSVLLMLIGSGLIAPRLCRRISFKGRGIGSHTNQTAS